MDAFYFLFWVYVPHGATTISEESGVLQSPGYPNGYTKSSSWKFRVNGAQRFYVTFDDIDLDNDCDSQGYDI